jgi:hypothetical protein
MCFFGAVRCSSANPSYAKLVKENTRYGPMRSRRSTAFRHWFAHRRSSVLINRCANRRRGLILSLKAFALR